MRQRNLLSESNQIQPLGFCPTFASSKGHKGPRHNGSLTIKKKTMARKFGLMIGGRSTQPCIANEARRQMALMNKYKMNRGGKGVASQPFYVKFLNR